MPGALFATDACILPWRAHSLVIELEESCPRQIVSVLIDEGVLDVLVEIINADEELAII